MEIAKKYSKQNYLNNAEIDKLISEKFTFKYDSFYSFKKDITEKIEKAIKDVEDGKGITIEEYIKELEAKNEWV